MAKYQLWQSYNVRHVPVWIPYPDAPLFDSPTDAADWGRAQNPGAFNTLSIWQVDFAPADGMAAHVHAQEDILVTESVDAALAAGLTPEEPAGAEGEAEEAEPTNKRGARK